MPVEVQTICTSYSRTTNLKLHQCDNLSLFQRDCHHRHHCHTILPQPPSPLPSPAIATNATTHVVAAITGELHFNIVTTLLLLPTCISITLYAVLIRLSAYSPVAH